MNKTDRIILIMIIFIVLIQGYIIYKGFVGCKACSMLVDDGKVPERLKNGLLGYYNPNGEYMCVWLDMPNRWVDNTIYHETCHHMVHKKPEHFCGWYVDKKLGG